MSTPEVSVIIPAYNSAATLPRALDSVFAQGFRDFEVIVIDDGSKDDTSAVLAPYRERVRVIKQSNEGAAAARNHGVRQACGRLLAFLDADDFWHPSKLGLQLVAFGERPDIVLCWTGHGVWQPGEPKPSTDISDLGPTRPQYSSDFNSIFLQPYLGTPGVVMKKSFFTELGGFRQDLRSAEDIDLWLRAAYLGPTAQIPCPLFYVVATSGGLTSLHGDGTYRDNLRVIEDFCFAHPQFAALSPSIVKRAKARVYEEWGSSALAQGDFRAAAGLLHRSLKNRLGIRASYLWTKAVTRRILDF